ncbi:MAG TPA: glycosyltransferase, partial [Gemmatimonadaceae bacterium]|nr:glycosyltransferase [Gemmatimonadaceae bacterium]
TTYPSIEVIVVDDRSEDETDAIARRVASGDSRVLVLEAPPLPDDWFGKQWACSIGARQARGTILLFTDADTRHSRDLIPRAVNLLHAREADFVSVMGRQELGTFWERVIQPQVFTLLMARYGGTEWVNQSRFAIDKIANGQFLMTTRKSYDGIGGHESVKENVAEDLALAQRYFTAGKRTVLVIGLEQLSTRMYESFGEIIRGWMKNVFAGGRHTAPFGKIGRLFTPFALLGAPLVILAPLAALLAALLGYGPPELLRVSVVATVAQLIFWALIYRGFSKMSPLWAFTFPLGGIVLLYIFVRALLRGSRVEWKGREYRAA